MNIRYGYIIALLALTSLRGNEVEALIAAKLGALKVLHNQGKFFVQHNNTQREIKPYWVDPLLRKMNPDQLQTFLSRDGYIQLSELQGKYDIEYKLDAYGRINGGGPICGAATFIVGTVATGVAATGVFIATLPAGPAAAALAGAATAKGGMMATAAATAAVTASPTP